MMDNSPQSLNKVGFNDVPRRAAAVLQSEQKMWDSRFFREQSGVLSLINLIITIPASYWSGHRAFIPPRLLCL